MKLIQGDCLIEMQSIPDKSIDMILCDLPFGTTQNKWDSVLDLKNIWNEYKRIVKNNGAVVLFSQTPFDKTLGASNLPMLKYEWIWEKNKATGHLNANKAPMKAHENILVFYDKPPKYIPQYGVGTAYNNKHKPGDNGSNYGDVRYSERSNVTTRYPRSVLRFDVDVKAEFHPTQKPIALLEYLIKTYTLEGETVLDNTMGSGSTGVACVNTKRDFIGIELDKTYFDIATKRIRSAMGGE